MGLKQKRLRSTLGFLNLLIVIQNWYRQYANEQASEDRAKYEFEENEAKTLRSRLWADPAPIEPWAWRAQRREQRRRKR